MSEEKSGKGADFDESRGRARKGSMGGNKFFAEERSR